MDTSLKVTCSVRGGNMATNNHESWDSQTFPDSSHGLSSMPWFLKYANQASHDLASRNSNSKEWDQSGRDAVLVVTVSWLPFNVQIHVVVTVATVKLVGVCDLNAFDVFTCKPH